MQSIAGVLQRVTRSSAAKAPSAGSYRAPSQSSYTKLSSRMSARPRMGASKYISRSYSTAEPHPADPASTASVPILESLTAPVNPASITQESMLLKLEDLVSLPNTFAVVKIGGHQYKVTQGDQIMINSIDVPIQTSIILDKVLLVGSTEYTVIGQPIIPAAKVIATVEEHEKTEKVIIYKKRRRKTYARKTGHRQPYTLLRISDIMGAKAAPL